MTSPPFLSEERLAEATARLFSLLPAPIRDRDARGGRELEALFQILGRGSAEIDAELDRFLDALFVETAPDVALPAFAALVGAPPFAPLPSGQQPRAFIANLLRFRRGKGTARVLAELAADVTGEGAVVVEYHQRLARLADLIDPRPDRPALADPRAGDTAARAFRAADTAARLADLRSIARAAGRWHVPMVGIHLLRLTTPLFPAPRGALTPAALAGVPAMGPWPAGGVAPPAGYWQLAAQPGRKLRLFNPDRRAEAEAEGKAGRSEAHHLPDRLRRLPLHLETEELRHAALEGRPAHRRWFTDEGLPFAIFARRQGETTFSRIPPAALAICNLEEAPATPGSRPANSRTHTWWTGGASAPSLQNGTSPIVLGFDPATGRAITAAPGGGQAEIVELRVACATGIGRPIGAGPQERNTTEVPFEIRHSGTRRSFVRVVESTATPSGASTDLVRTVPTLAVALADVLSHGAGQRAFVVLARCDRELAPATISLHPGTTLELIAAQWRPKKPLPGVPDDPDRLGYIVRRERRFILEATLTVTAAAPPVAGEAPGELVLDGLELTRGMTLEARAASGLWLRHVTLRNPGAAALTAKSFSDLSLRIEDSLCGPLALEPGEETGQAFIAGSILSADGAALPALAARRLDARLCDVTLFGTARTKTLEATGCLFTQTLTVSRTQEGCLRHSSMVPGSKGPRRFRCQPDLTIAEATERKGRPLSADETVAVSLAAQPLFLDESFDEPTCALLHALCPPAIREGGESGTEMGVFGPWASGLRRNNLASLFDDFLPFGLEAAILDDTLSAPQALRRTTP